MNSDATRKVLAPAAVIELVNRFREGASSYRSIAYNETQLRREFIDPLLSSLGWDVANKSGYHNALKEVIHEDALRIGGNIKAPDYAIRLGGERQFFVEAKKPSVNIETSMESSFQLRRYAWSAKLPISILTNFQAIAVYDCRFMPKHDDSAQTARIDTFTFDQFENRWDELYHLFSKEAVLAGSLGKFAERTRRLRGRNSVDDAFLVEIDNWRKSLATDFAARNPKLTGRALNAAVQLLIDRIIFLRMAEDRGIERYGRLQDVCKAKSIYPKLAELLRNADTRYNSGLFHFDANRGNSDTVDTLSLNLSVSDAVLQPILSGLYYPESPYEFSVLAPDTLGQVYEQFLGKTIRLDGRAVIIEEKPAVRKAGGVYYTPDFIVKHIVKGSLDPLLEGKSPVQVSGDSKRTKNSVALRIIDPACGSGSFLIVAYQYLLDWYRDYYVREGTDKHSRGADPKVYLSAKAEWRLTIAERRRILLTHIYGVDIDPQAVEVTKLSLLLKVLEGENGDVLASQMNLFRMRALPDLASNIRCGNSLVGSDFFASLPLMLFDDESLYRINSFDWKNEFPFLASERGFDAVIGNPPWVSLSGKFGNEILTKEEADYLIKKFDGNTYMPNMYEYFVAFGLSLMRDSGQFSFIVPDRLGHNDQFRSLRKLILEDFRLTEVTYRAPFPGVTADTLIFRIVKRPPLAKDQVQIGDFAESQTKVLQSTIASSDERFRFQNPHDNLLLAALARLSKGKKILPFREVVKSTSGVGGRSTAITRERTSPQQLEILKGECIAKYHTDKPMFFEFTRANITGRTTDVKKLSWKPTILIRKTGSRLIASYYDGLAYPEQSLYFTYGECELNLFYILGALNSKLMGYIYSETMLTNKDSIAQIKQMDLDNLPIFIAQNKATTLKMDRVAELAKEITNDMKALRGLRTEHEKSLLRRRILGSEQKIDALIIDLYELSDEEQQALATWSTHLGILG